MMNRSQQADFLLIVLAAQLFVLPLAAQNFNGISHGRNPVVSTNFPPLPQLQSPVKFFRDLLAMTPEQRQNFLTNKSPEIRARLEAKINEYELLDPSERELRLRATELRWYLMPLLRASPTNREAQLALVPDDIRPIVKSRLIQWEILPPSLQDEFLENERALRYFSRLEVTNNFASGGFRHQPSDDEQARWNSLSDADRKRISAQFNQFFELTPVEKQKTLGVLSDDERQQMEKTLAAFDKLPPPQRLQCIHGFTKFAQMNPAERAQFLKNAERWSQMSADDRKAWRDLVQHVPQWPPLPPAAIMPPAMPKVHPHPAVATNLN
ncbi:MAG TPA: DUF3106 domain-containing protein [Verrucomicrobiae bacterium]|nr:DUF3106 domain-containing protein [Verrucomicrobiae bacterium]